MIPFLRSPLQAPSRRVVVDIGGTNVRFASVAANGSLSDGEKFQCADFATFTEAITAYRQKHPGEICDMAVAVACPVRGDIVSLTNGAWSFSIEGLKGALGLNRLVVVNDFEAQALAVPRLRNDEKIQIGGGVFQANAPMVVVGPGSGLGVGAVVSIGPGEWRAISGEGGHATWAPISEEGRAAHHFLSERYGHVSLERVLSGPGIVNLYHAVVAARGMKPEALDAAEVTERADKGTCPACVRALDHFFAVLGTLCGNLALTYGAFGGVYIGGGIIPRMVPRLQASRFRDRFEAKGRFKKYLAAIPTYVVTASEPGLLGAAAALDQQERVQ